MERIKNHNIEKGDPISVAEIAAIMAAKNTPQLIPMCHPIQITNVELEHRFIDDFLEVRAGVRSSSQTGVEMEALTAVSSFLLNIWDMVKMYEKDENGQYPITEMGAIRVERKIKGNGID